MAEVSFDPSIGVVTPLPSPLIFYENGHVARRDCGLAEGEIHSSPLEVTKISPFSNNENSIFRSRLSPLRTCVLTSP